MSDQLKQFYMALQFWISGGMKVHPYFQRKKSLCFQLTAYCVNNRFKPQVSLKLGDEMDDQFLDANLNTNTPFNANEEAYFIEQASGTHYENQARLDWITHHATTARESLAVEEAEG